jgi:hypothetical protein
MIRHFAFAAYLIAIVVLGTELMCQVFVPRSNRAYIFPPYSSMYRTTTPELTPGIFTNPRTIINSLGIRSDEVPAGVKRVVLLIGGSTAHEHHLDQELTWAHRLQDLLNSKPGAPKTWVGGLTRSGRASRHNVEYFDVIVPYMPKADLFLDLVGVNDFQWHLRTGYGPNQLDGHVNFNFSVVPTQNISGYSGVVRFYSKMKDWWLREKFAFAGDYGGFKTARDCRQSVPESQMIDDLGDLSAGREELRRNLHALVDRAERYGAPMVFITQPILWGAQGAAEKALVKGGGVGVASEWCAKKEYYSSEALGRGLESFNDVTRQVCGSADCSASISQESCRSERNSMRMRCITTRPARPWWPRSSMVRWKLGGPQGKRVHVIKPAPIGQPFRASGSDCLRDRTPI